VVALTRLKPWAPKENHWVCDRCRTEYHIIDEQPEVEKHQDHLDVTTFGDPKKVYLVNKWTELICSKCR